MNCLKILLLVAGTFSTLNMALAEPLLPPPPMPRIAQLSPSQLRPQSAPKTLAPIDMQRQPARTSQPVSSAFRLLARKDVSAQEAIMRVAEAAGEKILFIEGAPGASNASNTSSASSENRTGAGFKFSYNTLSATDARLALETMLTTLNLRYYRDPRTNWLIVSESLGAPFQVSSRVRVIVINRSKLREKGIAFSFNQNSGLFDANGNPFFNTQSITRLADSALTLIPPLMTPTTGTTTGTGTGTGGTTTPGVSNSSNPLASQGVVTNIGGPANLITFGVGQFAIQLNLLETLGAVDTLFDSDVVTMDRKSAEVSRTIRFRVPGAVTGTSATTLQTFVEVPVQTSVRLTPEVLPNGDFVRFNLNVRVSDFSGSGNSLVIDQADLNIPESTIPNGGSIFLVGTNRKSTSVTEFKVPILGDIPFLGELFRGTSVRDTEQVLVAIVTPKIQQLPSYYAGLGALRTQVTGPTPDNLPGYGKDALKSDKVQDEQAPKVVEIK